MDISARLVGLCSLIKKLMMNKNAKGGRSSRRLLLGAGAVCRSSSRKYTPQRGYVLVHVDGEEEGKRYEVPVKYLSSPDLVTLMKREGEEHLEEKIDGPLRVYCSNQAFNELLLRLGNKD